MLPPKEEMERMGKVVARLSWLSEHLSVEHGEDTLREMIMLLDELSDLVQQAAVGPGPAWPPLSD